MVNMGECRKFWAVIQDETKLTELFCIKRRKTFLNYEKIY